MTYINTYMANDFKLLVEELKYKLQIAFARIDKLELLIQDKVIHIQKLEEELGLEYSMKQSIVNKEERTTKKSNGKS
mgnify:CR=1 FL=1